MRFFNPKHPVIWFLVLFVIILIIFSGTIYRQIIKPNKAYLPNFIERQIDKRDNRQKPSPIVYKEEVTLKILEGWTLDDIATYLSDQGIITKESFKEIAGSSREELVEGINIFNDKFDFLADKPSKQSLEGFLFPDTYRVFTDASSEDIIAKMLANFDAKLTPQMRADIASQGKSIYEVIIMASLIEKEAPIDYSDPENKDARIVSDIFWGRLEIGQALQSDATLSYLLNDNNPAHSGADLQIDSPYNSYKYTGLPPTPICNPGIKAIEAAIYPIPTNYNYFLTTLDGSEIYYARTYDEHLQNKYKYLK